MNSFITLFSGELNRMRKYNILAAGIFVALLWVGVLFFTDIEDITSMVPLIVFIDATSMSMVLIGATMFYEKQEGTIKTLLVSPIGKSEYILAKIFANISSNVLTLVLIYVYAKLFKEINLNFFGLLGASILIAFFHSLIGFIMTYNTKDFTEMLMGMMKYTFIFTIPVLLEQIGFIKNETIDKILYIIPTKSSSILLQATGGGMDNWKTWFAIIYLILATLGLFFIVWKKFDDFKIKESGE
ncbi:ABC-type transport system, permease component [[Clostridium] ultunense Esp]|uniref:ABC-type transport system, permease component n=1 Tax=[Clostridium] ultunense Esp TaxID=1288971 RepID=M1ZIM6_9FIRM|nr:ABC transporter permease [Schnuerera ultunensis]CCQ93807.1 ABC-type transport system, permease component [[Clostridium] ultunense Esp]SHD76789.1 ABC-type transport system, permease component [[Clostridium] ultunense Esp]